MIEASYTLEIDVGVDEVWEFVEVIPNWAHFLIGFQKLDLVDDRRSIWTLRGDVGILARDVDLQVDITSWQPGERAEFTLTGLTERISGQGSFELSPVEGEIGPVHEAPHAPAAGSGVPAAAAGRPAEPERPSGARARGLLRRLRFALAGRLLRWLNRRAVRPQPVAGADRPATGADRSAPGVGPAPDVDGGHPGPAPGRRSRLRFELQLTPGGPMAPMIELLMTPMVEPAAEDFLRNIRQALEARRSTT